MKSRRLNTTIIIAALTVAATALISAPAERPNILIIMSDDSGYADLGTYGGEINTPNIDSLAEQGIKFSSFYTNGRCSPTRASLFTGLDCARVGFGGGSLGDWVRQIDSPAHRGRLPYKTPLLPELLKEEGYQTMMSGKWHLGGSVIADSPERQNQWKFYHEGWELTEAEIEAEFNALPPQRGFDQYFGLHGAQADFFVTPNDNHEYFEGNEPAELNFERTYEMHCWYPNEQHYAYTPNHGKTSKAFYDTDGVTDRAIQMLEGAANEDAPFFAYVAYRAPHTPLQAPEALVQKYIKQYDDLEKFQNDRFQGLLREKLIPEGTDFKKANLSSYLNPDQVAAFKLRMAVHAAMLEVVDQNVGRIVKSLEETNQRENTIILYFSDNGAASHVGELMNKPFTGSKALVWEGGTKSHFIASWPGHFPQGSVSNTTVWVGDLLPTVLDLIGKDYPSVFRETETLELDGRNVLPALKGQEMAPPETLFFNDKGQQAVIYQGRWKLLIEPGWYLQTIEKPGIVYELYDLKSDPTETKNIASQKPELLELLRKKSEAWKAECGILDYAEIMAVRPQDPF